MYLGAFWAFCTSCDFSTANLYTGVGFVDYEVAATLGRLSSHPRNVILREYETPSGAYHWNSSANIVITSSGDVITAAVPDVSDAFPKSQRL